MVMQQTDYAYYPIDGNTSYYLLFAYGPGDVAYHGKNGRFYSSQTFMFPAMFNPNVPPMDVGMWTQYFTMLMNYLMNLMNNNNNQ